MTDKEVRELYLTGQWTKNTLHTLKEISTNQVKRATAGLTRIRRKPFCAMKGTREEIIYGNS